MWASKRNESFSMGAMTTMSTSFISTCVFTLISFTLIKSCVAQDNVSLATNLVEAANAGDIELVVKLVEAGAEVNGVHGGPSSQLADENGGYTKYGKFWTPLRAAVANEHDAIASYLIGAGAKVTGSDRPEWSEFHYIAFRDRKKNVNVLFLKLLLIAGADPEIPFKCISSVHDSIYFNMTPLQIARIQGNLPLEKFLREQTKTGKTTVLGTKEKGQDPKTKLTRVGSKNSSEGSGHEKTAQDE